MLVNIARHFPVTPRKYACFNPNVKLGMDILCQQSHAERPLPS